MACAFAHIAVIANVQAIRTRMGRRQAYRQAKLAELEIAELEPLESEFTAQRDRFHRGTVGKNGWPYVQHRVKRGIVIRACAGRDGLSRSAGDRIPGAMPSLLQPRGGPLSCPARRATHCGGRVSCDRQTLLVVWMIEGSACQCVAQIASIGSKRHHTQWRA